MIGIVELTCPIQWLAICPPPGQLWNGDPNGSTAQEDIVSYRTLHPGHSRMDPWPLATPELSIAKQNAGEALGISAPESGVNEGH